jgi:imidazolonepropionase-like amidohydrolase
MMKSSKISTAVGLTMALALVFSGHAQETVIHAGHLIDGVTKKSQDKMSIIIRKDKIVAVQPGFVDGAAGASIIDLSGETVLPGLIDCHKHLGPPTEPSGAERRITTTPMDAALGATVTAKILLQEGFTAIRNVGASGNVDISVKHAIDHGWVVGPRMWVSLEPLCPTGGHCDPQNGLNLDISDKSWEDSVEDSPWGYTKAVREHRRRGADLIKIMPSGGVLSANDNPKFQLMSDEEIKAAIDAAHALGMKVAAHAQGKSAIDSAVRSGVDSIEHGSFADAETYKLMNEHGTYLVATQAAAARTLHTAQTHPELLGPSAWKGLVVPPKTLSNLHDAYLAGVKIAFGTDVGAGMDLNEWGLMRDAGMKPMDIIFAATHNAADLIGVPDQIGEVAPGLFADIVAVKADPLADITSLKHVNFVMKGGIVYKKEDKDVTPTNITTASVSDNSDIGFGEEF